ncbi:PLxRFG domain-containing protein [Acinetobacter bereziniae]|uniref:PLxRFG domain-containing protein n=1 Tax=Acinetobacter bereziniae TaxID=106648 RepID=UPI00301A3799
MSDTQDNNKSKFSFDPSTAKPVDSPSVVKPDSFTFDSSTAKEDKKGIKGHAQDVGASLMGGLAAVPDTLVGLADMYTEGRAGKAIDDNLSDFYKLGNAQKYWQDQKTDVAKQQQQQFHDAEGIVDKTKIALQNPSMIANAAVESLPSMFLGGALGKATKIANPIAAAAVGEGAVMAGAQAEQIRQNSDDQMLNNGQEAASALTGGLGALFGFAGGRIAQKLGIGDIDSMIVSGRIGPTQIAGEIANTSSKSLPRRVIEGAISEGFLEELPQSISEQIIQNLATEKHWSDGVDDAAVMGTLAGMAMGGVANIPSGHSNNAQGDNNNLQTESNPTSPLPQLGGPSMEDEYIPRGASEQNSANVNQTNYEYTQFDSDASNRLGNNGFGSTDTGNGPTDPVQPDIGGGSYFDSQKPSERLGLNPDNGPMSSAAALAVDSGAFTSATSMGDAASATSRREQVNAGTNFSDNTAQAIQYGMGEIAQGAKEAALENTIQRLEKDGEVQLFKQDSIAKALEDQNYNVRLNKDGSASIIGVKNPSTNEWHGTERTDSSIPALNMADTQDQSSESNTSQQLATLQQRFDEAKTVPEKAKIRKEINQLQNNQLQPDVNSNDKMQSTDEPEIRNSEVPDSTGTQFTSSSNSPTNDVENVPNEKESKSSPVTNDVTDQINQLEQKLLAAKSVPQKAKIRNQINQLKSQQIESSEKPQNTVLNPEQIQTQYGDGPESVMSDIEILGDDFTVDLREDNKKANALNNPNYNAVQKSDGSVEIVGMKHPTTGEWVGKKPTAVSIDENAHQAATSAQNNTPEPTQAQIEAGNYKKGHIKVQGLDISIENPKGSERRGTDPNGKAWAHTMSDHYGYIKRTVGADSEQIDTYIGNNPESDQVFIVDQIDQETGNFDEHKVMLGFDSQDNATKAYQSNFDKGWKVGQIRSMTVEQFKDWLKNGDTTKPSFETEQTSKVIRDLGEKIGGARKDNALSTGKTSKAKITDDRPTWAKRYAISEIVSSTNTDDNGKWVIEDSRKSDWKGNSKRMATFSSQQEAEEMLPVLAVAQKHRIYARRESEGGFEIWRLINDYKRVKVINQVFESKEDAQKYLVKNAAQILETNTTFGEIDLPRPENTLRKGVERRKGDVKDTDFMDVFGFRGVEFGNWNNQVERQQLLNDAFDGLLDLADVLNIPAKAISLNGDLALAFGARGQGLSSARAHYEPAKAVINLTKMNGAGSLAHEWWHAFDHYLARQDGKAVAEWSMGKDGTRSLKISSNTKENMASGGFSYSKSGVRNDVQESYNLLMQTMFSKAEEYVEDTQQVDNFVGKAREVVAQNLDSIRNDLSKELDPKYYKRFNKPAPTELLTEFDTIAQQISQGEMLNTEWRSDVVNKKSSGIFSGARWTNDGLEKLSQIYKKVRGRSGFNTDQKGVLDQLRSSMNQYSSRLKMLAEAQKGSTKIKKVPTSFAMNAKDLDSGRGSDYWTSPHEMSARAFQGFVEDKIKEQSGKSPLLNYAPENAVIETPWGWTRPFPHGSERKAINEKFDNLVDTLKTEETETGIKLYSRDKLKHDNERKNTSPLSTSFLPISKNRANSLVTDILSRISEGSTPSKSKSGINGVVESKFPFIVVESFETLPEAIQQENYYQDEDGNTKRYDVSAVWHKGTLYINAGDVQGNNNTQQTTYEAYEEVILHEVVGHFGVQQLFGQEYKTKFQQLFNALGGIEGIRKIAKDNGVDMNQFDNAYIKPFKKGVEEGYYDPLDAQQATVSELFAFIAQNAKTRPFVRQKLKEIIGYIRQWFRERGFDKFLSRYNDADLMMFLSEARKAVVDRSYFGKYKNQNISAKNDSDTPLYSRSRENKTGSTINQVRDLLIERFGKDTINELERQGKLEIIQDYQVEGVEGFYYNGKAVLVASNLTNESAIPTFLHELGGHAGFQNMMNQEQYNELMRQFDKLVEQGNPVAMAAKLLAEREQGNVRQQLEYLPYLLTLSSTMQQRNVIQRNALQKLINNIVSYVKAWVFDNFGINLNLNPDDMLALSERMVNQIKQQSSLDTVRQKYHGTSQWMTAPNGEKTQLSEQQWLQVRTPEFKNWFGDWENDAKNASQVLDDNGEPKVVYHGTATQFTEFRKGHGLLGDGIYLTDSFDTADMYANNRGKNGFVLPLFVNIRNALKTTGNVSRDKVVEATNSGKYQGIVHQFEDQELIVALESNQVKIAEGNTGTFNSESADIRFSKSADELVEHLSENIKNLYTGNFKLPSMADAMKYGLMFLSRMQITDIYKAILPQLSVYNDLVRQMDADKNDIAAEADNIVREWSKLKDEEALANVMHEATLAQIDPAKPYQQGDDKVKYQQLFKNYNNLSPEAQVMYKKARNAYSKHYAKVREAVRERILRSALSSEKKADLLKKIEGSFGQIKGVYFPLARFGKYVVVVRNQNGDVESISRTEAENEANALREQLMQKYPQFEIDPVIRDQEYNALRDKVGRGFMSELFDEVGNLGLDAQKQAEFEDTLGQLYLSSMPDLSWAKHGMHRKGTAGFSQNARRAFAQNMSSGAGYLAKLRYADQLVAQLDEMKEYAKAQIKKDPNYKQPLASAVIDEMNARHENLMNAKGNALSSLLTSMGFVYFLGLSPAAAMVNIMQTPLVAYPIMGAKFGFDKAGSALIKASVDYAKGVEFNMPDFTNLDSFRKSIGDSIDPYIAKILKDHEKQAYDKAIAAGVIDVTQAHDLAGIAQGEDSGIMWKTRPIMRAASLMFHHAERFNREVTFIAAYRLSKESGMADNEAYKQAVKMTYDGHFDYSASNRARFMQGNVAKVVFLFKQFGQNMIYTIARQSYIALIGKNHTKEERIEAARAISAMLVTHALAAGVLGLPMVTTILAIASGLVGIAGGGDDDPWDAEVALRNGLADMTSPTFSNLVMKGLSRGTPADISGRVGLDSMFLAKTQDGLEGKKLYEQIIIGNLGATVGMGANIAKGIQELGQGNYARALEEMLPTFAKNPFKAYRYAIDGVQDKTGIDIMDGKPVSSAGIFSQTIGFSPSQVRTAYEGKSAIYQQQQALQKRRSKLTSQWVRAKRNDDQEGMDSAWKDIQEFNEINPKQRINRINLMQSYHQNAKRIRDAENGVYLSNKYRDISDYGRFAVDQ